MSKVTITVTSWRAVHKNTLRGFAAVRFDEMRMSVADVAVHAQGDQAWAQPPSKPWLGGTKVVIDSDGKPRYLPIFQFDTAEVRSAFSAAVVRALQAKFPFALDPSEGAP